MENSASNTNCISTKNFEETRSTYSASKVIEIFMSSDTDDITNKLFGTNFYKNFKKQQKYQMKEEVNLFMKMQVYCIIIISRKQT